MGITGRLWQKIAAKREKSATGQYFLPTTELRAILTREEINISVAELDCADHERIGLAEKIYQDGLIIFAILTWMKHEAAIVNFRNHDALDASLPLHEERAVEIVPEFGRVLATEIQWQFLPYTFTRDMCDYHRILDHSEVILPFIKEEPLAEGGFGQVYKMTVLSSQQQFFPPGKDPVIIRKKLKIQGPQRAELASNYFAQEMTCLKLLHRLQHPNLVPLLGSYTHKGEHSFLFPCLDMDMEAFFKLDCRFGEFKRDLTFFSALRGLASALQNVHVLRLKAKEHGVDLAAIGYHHDLRPANILVDQQNLLLADFSLGKIKPSTSPSKTIWNIGIGDYIAPECMGEELVGQSVGRAIDIWAFGCLLAEVATYVERGSTGIKDFRSKRLTADLHPNWEEQYFFGKGAVKPEVLLWLQALVSNPRNELIPDLVDLALSLLQIDPVKRPSAAQLSEDLSYLSVKAHLREVSKRLSKYLSTMQRRGEEGPPLMKVWFESERVNALGRVMGLIGSQPQPEVPNQAGLFFEKSQEILLALLRRVDLELDEKSPRSDTPSMDTTVTLDKPLDEILQILVQSLIDLLPQRYQKRMETAWGHASLATRDTNRLNMIRASCNIVSQPQYVHVGALAAMKALRLHFLAGTGMGSKHLLLSKDDVEITESSQEPPIMGLYKKRIPVLVEWVYYSPKWTGMSIDQRKLLMQLKAEGFGIRPKPRGLKILDCIGFYEDAYGYGFVYPIPDQYCHSNARKPTTLLALLVKDATRDTIDMQPLLGAKFKLAAALAVSLMELHMAGWLHENISSKNILLFGIDPKLPVLTESLQDPYLMGFQKSRPDSETWYTDGPSEDAIRDYQHPKYSREARYTAAFDFYSMGLILLEIGLWTPLAYWSNKKPTATPEELRSFLISKYVPRLGQKMGRAYKDAVLTCLNGTLEEGSDVPAPSEGHEPLLQFIESVVEPLEELAALPV
ncbi:kinase-like protein [Lepidopterella palustris CBS 459.81]|uniref:Kinase-like protein n=1 Tax=Lepidopterella palustris CBS 459.81 TaxID=1314670 RepID=A0A8E2JDE5_9PEZI|nr:kinase-like protein [Lepidopterella palustris CBS 459.81]